MAATTLLHAVEPLPAGARPLVRMIVSAQATTIAEQARRVVAAAPASGVKVVLETARTVTETAWLLRRPADVVILDGHGHGNGKIGHLVLGRHVRRDADGRGISAPGVVLGCCQGATAPYRRALRDCLEGPVAFLGCEGFPLVEDAALFGVLIEELARVPEPAPGAIRAAMVRALQRYPRSSGWITGILHTP